MNNMIYIFIQITVMILAAPLVNGIIVKVKAFSQKRKGPPLLQMYFDLFKLIRKRPVVSATASWLFRSAHFVVLSSAAVAAAPVPVSTFITPASFPGDAILLVSVLALGRFFMMLASLDTGGVFGGMGSSREAIISSLI